jgi:hypothetical protein
MNQVNQETKVNSKGNRRGMNGNSQKNLRPNKNGRPKNAHCITDIQRKMLPQPCPYKQGVTWAEYLAERGMAMASENATYYRELMDRLEGKVTQPIQGDGTITLRVKYD